MVIEGIPPAGITAGLALVAFGGWSLAAYFFRLVYRGQLVPAHDRDEWRAESRIKDEQIAKKDDQLEEKDRQLSSLVEVGKTVDAIIRGVQKVAERNEMDLR